MTITVRAVYERGVLRPFEPLRLPEGETVELTIDLPGPVSPPLQAANPEEEAYAQRIKAARSLEEMYAIMATAPPLSGDYDLCQALNANRKTNGERHLFKDPSEVDEP